MQGRHRTFLVYAPEAGARNGRLPILMVLHGGLGNGRFAVQQTGIADYVGRVGLLAVFPNAAGEQWNDGRNTTDNGLDDVAFLRSVIARMVQTQNGDPSRAFAMGVSNGDTMAQRMACDAADAVMAVGSVIANMPQDLARHCRPSRPIPVMMISATEDPIMPWNGGEIASSPSWAGPAASLFRRWIHSISGRRSTAALNPTSPTSQASRSNVIWPQSVSQGVKLSSTRSTAAGTAGPAVRILEALSRVGSSAMYRTTSTRARCSFSSLSSTGFDIGSAR